MMATAGEEYMFPFVPRHNINLSVREYFRAFLDLFTRPRSSAPVADFEQAFAQYIGASHSIAFSSGSAALYYGLALSGLEKGDQIIVPAYEFTTVIETIRLLGFVPIFAKVSEQDGNITPESIQSVITKDVKAVLVAHIHGRPADVEKIGSLCREKDLFFIEDCAHCAGAKIGNKRAGAFGDFSIFSFGDGKSLTTCKGGMAVTSNDDLANRLKSAAAELQLPSWPGEVKRLGASLVKILLSTRLGFSLLLYPPSLIVAHVFGINIIDKLFFRGAAHFAGIPESYGRSMPDASARLGLSQLQRLDDLNRVRKENAEIFIENLKAFSGKKAPSCDPQNLCTWLNFTLTLDDVAGLRMHLFKSGIDTRVDYLLRYDEQHPDGVIPKTTLYLPNHPGVTGTDTEAIARKVNDYPEPS